MRMYKITDYDKLYMPRDKSRHPLVHAEYVKLPINPRGDGLQTLLKHKRGLEVFAIWCLLLEKTTAQKPENRGKLLNHKDEPATPAEIAMGISLERQIKLVIYALSVLVEMGWVKQERGAGICGESAPLSVVKCSEVKCSVKNTYLEFVKLTKEEHRKLVEKFGEEGTEQRIAALNDYVGSKGKKYTSHYHTILSWERRDKASTGSRKQKLWPITGKTCSMTGCGMPAVYKDASGSYDRYACKGHLPDKVKELYE